MTKKDELRRQFRRRRSTAGDLEVLIHQVSTILRRVGAGTVGLYWPLAGEVNLLSLCQGLEARVALAPMVVGIWTTWFGAETIWNGRMPHSSPSDYPLKPDQLNLLMIPALSVDPQGYRWRWVLRPSA